MIGVTNETNNETVCDEMMSRYIEKVYVAPRETTENETSIDT